MATDIELYQAPWVQGTLAKAHVGPISSEIFVDDREPARRSAWIRALVVLLEALRDQARAARANAVVGIELTLDPFACSRDGERSGVRLSAQGAAVVLESTA